MATRPSAWTRSPDRYLRTPKTGCGRAQPVPDPKFAKGAFYANPGNVECGQSQTQTFFCTKIAWPGDSQIFFMRS